MRVSKVSNSLSWKLYVRITHRSCLASTLHASLGGELCKYSITRYTALGCTSENRVDFLGPHTRAGWNTAGRQYSAGRGLRVREDRRETGTWKTFSVAAAGAKRQKKEKYIYIYIYIYREREREKERYGGKATEDHRHRSWGLQWQCFFWRPGVSRHAFLQHECKNSHIWCTAFFHTPRYYNPHLRRSIIHLAWDFLRPVWTRKQRLRGRLHLFILPHIERYVKSSQNIV